MIIKKEIEDYHKIMESELMDQEELVQRHENWQQLSKKHYFSIFDLPNDNFIPPKHNFSESDYIRLAKIKEKIKIWKNQNPTLDTSELVASLPFDSQDLYARDLEKMLAINLEYSRRSREEMKKEKRNKKIKKFFKIVGKTFLIVFVLFFIFILIPGPTKGNSNYAVRQNSMLTAAYEFGQEVGKYEKQPRSQYQECKKFNGGFIPGSEKFEFDVMRACTSGARGEPLQLISIIEDDPGLIRNIYNALRVW